MTTRLELKSFRNYKDLDITFSEGTTILYGENAQGKTNILEAVYMAATARSHRGAKDREMIMCGENEAHIKLSGNISEDKIRIDVHLKKNHPKGMAVNGMPIRRMSDHLGRLKVVIFSPEDLNIIKAGPAERRKFINTELCQLKKNYALALIEYNRVLAQRNCLLKEMYFHPEYEDMLEIWDDLLSKNGAELVRERRLFCKELEVILSEKNSFISEKSDPLTIRYEPDTEAEEIKTRLLEARPAEKKQKTTLVGPHRDDINFFLNGMELKKFGSQGQQRTAAVSLKLSEMEFIKKKSGENPMLLLDDVMSELDEKRQRALLHSIDGIQTIVTCTGIEDFIKNSFSADCMYKVKAGRVSKGEYPLF